MGELANLTAVGPYSLYGTSDEHCFLLLYRYLYCTSWHS